MRVYKVVRQCSDGILRSVQMWNMSCGVTYRDGDESIAAVGGLLCFENLDHAKRFQLQAMSRFASISFPIFECEAHEPVDLPPQQAATKLMPSVREAWEEHKLYKGAPVWPEGTVAFRRVTLLHRVE
jgi:hypothetical protein